MSVAMPLSCAQQPSTPENVGAQLFQTRTSPSYSICLRPNQLVDTRVRHEGRWSDCDTLPELIQRSAAQASGNRRLSFVDVGANIGACALLMAAQRHQVLALEPVPATYAALAAGFAANAWPPGVDMRMVNAAASDHVGDGFIQSNVGNAGDSITAGVGSGLVPWQYWKLPGHQQGRSNFSRHAIRLTTLDHILPLGRPVDLIKIDTQGHELRVIRGATNLLRRPRYLGVRTIVFEFYPPAMRLLGDDPVVLLELLHSHGFSLRSHVK
jgi:FkbM family methyltransferase